MGVLLVPRSPSSASASPGLPTARVERRAALRRAAKLVLMVVPRLAAENLPWESRADGTEGNAFLRQMLVLLAQSHSGRHLLLSGLEGVKPSWTASILVGGRLIHAVPILPEAPRWRSPRRGSSGSGPQGWTLGRRLHRRAELTPRSIGLNQKGSKILLFACGVVRKGVG